MTNYRSVLLVDDDPTQIAILTAYFASLKVETILSASDSAEALKTLEDWDGDLDLIVTDLQMPKMDGLEFMRHLKDQRFDGDLAIMSGVKSDLLGHASRLARMHKLKLIGQATKPLSKETLDSIFVKHEQQRAEGPTPDARIITQQDFANALVCNEIVPHYQPKVDVRTGKVVGAEALARWRTAFGTNISPELFIAFAERNGRIEELTFYLFEKVLDDMAKILAMDPDQRMAINLAPEMISNIALPDQLCDRLRGHDINATNISFEITENSILNLRPATLEVLSRLRIHDFEVAIDDFGTGSSNIQTLRDFPYSELKIDRSFISNATTNAFSRETVHAAIALAHEQKMQVVAEGVEDMETWNFIREQGIEYAQGYLMAPAMPVEDYCRFVTLHRDGWKLKAA